MKRLLLGLAAVIAFAQGVPVAETPYQLIDARSGTAIACAGCSLYSYLAGTNTPSALFSDYTLATPLSNPVVTNSAGYATTNGTTVTGVFVGGTCYKLVAKDANAVTLWTQDRICAAGTSAAYITTGILTPSHGGTGIANTASLTLGSSAVNLATLPTGIVYHTTTTGALTTATGANIVAAFSGCSGTKYLGADGACHAENQYNHAAFSLTAANMNSTSDQAMTLTMPAGFTRYVIRHIVFSHASTSMTTAAGGIYTNSGKAGVIVVDAAQVYTGLVTTSNFIDATIASDPSTSAFTPTTLYFSLTTPQGSTATADINIFVEFLP